MGAGAAGTPPTPQGKQRFERNTIPQSKGTFYYFSLPWYSNICLYLHKGNGRPATQAKGPRRVPGAGSMRDTKTCSSPASAPSPPPHVRRYAGRYCYPVLEIESKAFLLAQPQPFLLVEAGFCWVIKLSRLSSELPTFLSQFPRELELWTCSTMSILPFFSFLLYENNAHSN